MGHQIRMVPAVDKWVAKLEAPVRNGWNGMPPSSAARRMLGKMDSGSRCRAWMPHTSGILRR